MRDRGLEPPPYLPPIAHAVVRWTRNHVLKVAGREGVPLEDLWDEAMAALLRACVYYDATPGPTTRGDAYKAFSTYACLSVIRGCRRYVARTHHRIRDHGPSISLDDDPAIAVAPSAEDEAAAREGIQHRWRVSADPPRQTRHGRTTGAVGTADAVTASNKFTSVNTHPCRVHKRGVGGLSV